MRCGEVVVWPGSSWLSPCQPAVRPG